MEQISIPTELHNRIYALLWAHTPRGRAMPLNKDILADNATQALIDLDKCHAMIDVKAFLDYMTNTELVNVEVWEYEQGQSDIGQWQDDACQIEADSGWYWWYCLPGCLSNDYPHGPHLSHQAAVMAAYVAQYETEEI